MPPAQVSGQQEKSSCKCTRFVRFWNPVRQRRELATSPNQNNCLRSRCARSRRKEGTALTTCRRLPCCCGVCKCNWVFLFVTRARVACPCRVPVSCALCRVPNNRLARLQTCRNLAGVLLTASYSPVVIVDRNSLLPNTLVCVALFHIVICYSFFVANHSVLLIIQCCHSVLPFGVAVRSHDVVVVGVAQQVFKLQWNAY